MKSNKKSTPCQEPCQVAVCDPSCSESQEAKDAAAARTAYAEQVYSG